MRIIIDCDPENYDAACARINEELRDWECRYNKVGWGWVFGLREGAALCFVRRIKDGLSLRQTSPRSRPAPQVPGESSRDELNPLTGGGRE